MAGLRTSIFRLLVRGYVHFEERVVSGWHEDYQRTFARLMFGLKRRLFPGQGKGGVVARFEGLPVSTPVVAQQFSGTEAPQQNAPAGQTDWQRRTAQFMEPPADSPLSIWLWLEQQNLAPVARHQDIAHVDWNHFRTSRHAPGRLVLPEVRALHERLSALAVTHVLMFPWLKHGGADKASIAYVKALSESKGVKVLVITTEDADSPWLTSLGAGTEVIEWGRLVTWQGSAQAVDNLAWLLQRLQPEVIHVINAWLGWELLKACGARLHALSRVFVSLFWYGPGEASRLRGYASEYLPSLMPNLDAVICDNHTFPLRLQQDYGFPAAKFHCVLHPTDHFAAAARTNGPADGRLRIMWASRFAPEKKLDLLLAMAKARPQFAFGVFGVQDGEDAHISALLQALAALPNVAMHGAFNGFSALPVDDYDLFLYTSSSDGMPNVVIEAMAHGIPLIAPAVGGVAEIVRDDTGWLVEKIDDTETWLAALDQAASNPADRLGRATRALALMRERHDFSSFLAGLHAVPGYLQTRHPIGEKAGT